MQQTKDIILLIGAPGAGKSLLGEALQKNTPGEITFMSIGNCLRNKGLVDDYFHCTTSPAEKAIKKANLRQAARAIIEQGIKQMADGSTLALECVKDIDDAFILMEIIHSRPEAKLKHVFYVSHQDVGTELLRKFNFTIQQAIRREEEHSVLERQGKWESNVQALIEFFTSMEIVIEVSTRQNGSNLARLGYGCLGDELFIWKIRQDLPTQLTFTPLEPVVSKRLVINRQAIDSALQGAEGMTGLAMFGHETRLPVPSTPIQSTADAEWISWPGRYCVSRKCDGTRHILITGEKGTAMMLNRAGSVYAYPITTPLPAGTVLDGELVWIADRGFFIAFDTISAGGRHARAWQLPLQDRVALLNETLQLEEAEACIELRAAAEEQIRRTAGQPPQHAWSAWICLKEECRARVKEESADELARRRVQRSSAPTERKKATRFQAMSMDEWEKTPEFGEWQEARIQNVTLKAINSTPALRVLHKKQQAPLENDEVKVVWKNHSDASPQSLRLLQETLPACPYPTDGLVFTPKEAPYALGMLEMLRKWQPADKATGDIKITSYSSTSQQRKMVQSITPMSLVNGLVYECFFDADYRRMSCPLTISRLSHKHDTPVRQTQGWMPASIRWDKRNGNSQDSLCRLGRDTEHCSFQDMVDAATSVDKRFQAFINMPTPSLIPAPIHPARAFASPHLLREAIMAAVADGRVEHTIDAETDLEIFNCNPLHGKGPTPVEALCRGLILHGTTIVATPFTRFSVQGWRSTLHTELARAAFKVDGSLAIAFLWEGQVQVSTRRRMDSQQARWTRAWLRANVKADEFQGGWTYLFEAVFRENTVIVPYAFEAPVLLAIFSPDGERLPHSDCVKQARRMGVIMTPSITGTLGELEKRLPDPRASAPPTHEGWIVTLNDGVNTKRVTNAYKEASVAKINLHPLTVWDRVRTGGESREAMLHAKGLAKHHSEELAAMLDALQAAYANVTRQMLLSSSSGGGQPEELTTALAEVVRMGTLNRESMHYTYWRGDKIRVLLMDCIRPGFNGCLPGYTPSSRCVHTIAKDWPNGPREGRLAAGTKPLIHEKLHESSLLARVLEQLEGGSMGHAMLVNKEWSSVICLAPGFQTKVNQVGCFFYP
jgi:adenylate kinase family enzyme